MSFRIVVTGVSGQVGGSLMALPPIPGVTFVPAGRGVLDLARPRGLAAALAALAPDAVVNCAAHTAVDRAESEAPLAFAVNAEAAGELAAACAARGAPMVQLSTDYVFDGSKTGAWTRTDAVAPLGVYGASKEAGERAVRAACPKHLIFRTSWVYAARGRNFVRTMLRLGADRDELRVVADQTGCPTAAPDLAAALAALAPRLARGDDLPWGTWHLAGREATTWHGFAEAIFDCAAPVWGRRPAVLPIATAEYPTATPRPRNSALDSAETERALGVEARSWRDALPPIVAEILAQED
ncbi:dTDP-4-dehydrorhamnose reductase [Oleispirillum naphthae]|uniref:dTDP-4-dehydrorhamnose reductase n=1 Tax=Oleispirillum naphthae TaxID=2838853 RepID=UPI0030823D0A